MGFQALSDGHNSSPLAFLIWTGWLACKGCTAAPPSPLFGSCLHDLVSGRVASRCRLKRPEPWSVGTHSVALMAMRRSCIHRASNAFGSKGVPWPSATLCGPKQSKHEETRKQVSGALLQVLTSRNTHLWQKVRSERTEASQGLTEAFAEAPTLQTSSKRHRSAQLDQGPQAGDLATQSSKSLKILITCGDCIRSMPLPTLPL